MSLLTIDVSIDHGRGTLPETGRGLLTILPENTSARDPLAPHPVLSTGRILADPTEPLAAEDWPESQR